MTSSHEEDGTYSEGDPEQEEDVHGSRNPFIIPSKGPVDRLKEWRVTSLFISFLWFQTSDVAWRSHPFLSIKPQIDTSCCITCISAFKRSACYLYSHLQSYYVVLAVLFDGVLPGESLTSHILDPSCVWSPAVIPFPGGKLSYNRRSVAQ